MARIYDLTTGKPIGITFDRVIEVLEVMEKYIDAAKEVHKENEKGYNTALDLVHELKFVAYVQFKPTFTEALVRDLEGMIDELYIQVHDDS